MTAYYVSYPRFVRWVMDFSDRLYNRVHRWSERHAIYTPVVKGDNAMTVERKICRNPKCYDTERVKFGLCVSCRLAGAWGAVLAFIVGALLKLAGLL